MRPLDPANWPLTKPAAVKSLPDRLAELAQSVKGFGPNDRVGLMVNAADIKALLSALEER